MKLKKASLFVLFSTIALIVLLAIQVYWILQTAKIKEELFNEKANMVLSRTTEALSVDKETCRSINECIDNDNSAEITSALAKNDVRKIDSLLNHYMQVYHIHIDYTFNIVRQSLAQKSNESSFAKAIYKISLEDIAKEKGIDIKLNFPQKKQFIAAELGMPFFTSIVLILTMIIIFWRTNLLLIKEKKIASHSRDFLNNMSHEFKTPLANIALAAKMVAKRAGGIEPEKVSHYASIIIEENDKLIHQIDQVLNLNALERDEILINKTQFDFHTLIHAALKSMSMQIEHKNAKVHLQLEASKSQIIGDKQQLSSVICNLLDNAIKYANETLTITIKTQLEFQKLKITIQDNGIGIAKEFHQAVFEKYFRVPTNDMHNVKGFGLGLAYLKKVVELHDGEIQLQSEEGIGASFIIYLPHV